MKRFLKSKTSTVWAAWMTAVPGQALAAASAGTADAAPPCLVDGGGDQNDNRLIENNYGVTLDPSAYDKGWLLNFIGLFGDDSPYRNIYPTGFPDVQGGRLTFTIGVQGAASDEPFAKILARVESDLTGLRKLPGVTLTCVKSPVPHPGVTGSN